MDTKRKAGLVLHGREDLVLHALVLQVPDLDGRVGRRAQPVVLRAEAESLDRRRGVQGVQMLPVVTSHNIAVPSLPPEAHKEPSGEMVVEYTTPVWPTRLVRNLQLLKF